MKDEVIMIDHLDGMTVVVDRQLGLGPEDWQLHQGRIHVGSLEGFQRVVDKFNARWAVVRTSPLCLLNRLTGQLEDTLEYTVPIRDVLRPIKRWPNWIGLMP